MASVRRDLCQDTDPRALLATIQRQPRPPRHTPKRARPHQCVSTSPADPPFSSASAATRRAQPITPSASQVRTPTWLTARRPGSPLGVVTMSIHKLSAGSGYDYLTRQVAALDATEKGHVGLASYYTERGESPGAWIGSGLVGIDGLNAGDAVTAEQMRALFGAGMHPLATTRLEQPDAAALTEANVQAATRLGAPFKVYAGEVSPFRVEVAKRIAARQAAAAAGERVCLRGTAGAGPHRGGAGVLPNRAWPRSDRCPRDRRHYR